MVLISSGVDDQTPDAKVCDSGPNWCVFQPKQTQAELVRDTFQTSVMYCVCLHPWSSVYSYLLPSFNRWILSKSGKVCFPNKWHLGQLTWRNFTHGRWMPAIPLVAVRTLDKDGAITQALGKYLPSDVVEPHSSSCKQRKTDVFVWWAVSLTKGRKEWTALWPAHDLLLLLYI